MVRELSRVRKEDVKHHQKQLKRLIQYRQGVEHRLRYYLEVLQRQEKRLRRAHRRSERDRQSQREELYASARQSFQPDNPVTPDLKPLLALDPLAQPVPMSPLQLDGMDSDAESASAEDDVEVSEQQINYWIRKYKEAVLATTLDDIDLGTEVNELSMLGS